MNISDESSSSIFSFLKSQKTAQHKILVRETTISVGIGKLAHAIDSQGYPTFLIPVENESESIGEWSNNSIILEYRNIGIDGFQKSFLVLQCHSTGLFSQFSLLVDDIIQAISTSSRKAVVVTYSTLEQWKELLKEQHRSRLSDEQLIGVLAELLFLEEVSASYGPKILKSWQGPNGARHDFDFALASVEIKATMSRESFSAVFHGSKQLEPPYNRPLYVKGYQFELAQIGLSIPDVLNRLFRFGLSRFEILRLLESIGYSETDTDYYQQRRFNLLKSKAFLVDANFPKITSDTVEQGILDRISMLAYTVDLNLVDPVVLDISKIQA